VSERWKSSAKSRSRQGGPKPRLMAAQDAAIFRRKFLASLGRQQGWTAGMRFDFQPGLANV